MTRSRKLAIAALAITALMCCGYVMFQRSYEVGTLLGASRIEFSSVEQFEGEVEQFSDEQTAIWEALIAKFRSAVREEINAADYEEIFTAKYNKNMIVDRALVLPAGVVVVWFSDGFLLAAGDFPPGGSFSGVCVLRREQSQFKCLWRRSSYLMIN